jgi:hypothetical protein
MKKSKRFYIALALIATISWLGYTIIYESKFSILINNHRVLKHTCNFFWLICVFYIGKIGLKNHEPVWIYSLWTVSYTVIISLLFLLGLADLFLTSFLLNIKVGIAYLRFFFQSPMPFLLLLIISKLDFDVLKK